MGYNLTNARNGKKNRKKNNKRIRRFVWKKLLESKTLLSSNIFDTNPLNFPKIQTVV